MLLEKCFVYAVNQLNDSLKIAPHNFSFYFLDERPTMFQLRPSLLSLLIATISFTAVPCLLGITSSALAAERGAKKPESARQAISIRLNEVPELIAAKKFNEAYGKVNDAENAGGITAYEKYIIGRFRLDIALAAQDGPKAEQYFESIDKSERFPSEDKLALIKSVAVLYSKEKNIPKKAEWLARYDKESGITSTTRSSTAQTYFDNGDFPTAMKETQSEIQAIEKEGKAPAESQLILLAVCARKLADQGSYGEALEKLAQYYPNPKYWLELINRIQTKPGYSRRLDVDVLRFKFAIGELNTVNDILRLSTLAIDNGLPAEAKKVLAYGYATNVIGQGADAAAHKQLQDEAEKKASKEDLKALGQSAEAEQKSKDGTALFNVGYTYVTMGQTAKGMVLMEQALARGGMKRADEAKLRLAGVYTQNEQREKALQIFRSLSGEDGSGSLAHLWTVYLSRPLVEKK